MFFKRKEKNKEKPLSEFRQNILKSNFEVAYELAKNMSMDDVFNDLYAIADPVLDSTTGTDLPYNLLPYAFVESVLMKEETIEYHLLAAGLMTMPYNVFPGAADVALWHSRRALKLDKHCINAAKTIVHLYEHEEMSATEEEYQNALKVIQG